MFQQEKLVWNLLVFKNSQRIRIWNGEGKTTCRELKIVGEKKKENVGGREGEREKPSTRRLPKHSLKRLYTINTNYSSLDPHNRPLHEICITFCSLQDEKRKSESGGEGKKEQDEKTRGSGMKTLRKK